MPSTRVAKTTKPLEIPMVTAQPIGEEDPNK